jgi:hypothetical protein
MATTRRTSAPGLGLVNGQRHHAQKHASEPADGRISQLGIDDFLELTKRTIDGLDRDVLEAMVECLMNVWRRRGTVFVMGNGGSASTASTRSPKASRDSKSLD